MGNVQEKIGRILEVSLLDDKDINPKKICFKIVIDNEIVNIIEDLNEENANIFKDDLVIIRKQTISGKKFTDIELYEEGEVDDK